MADRPRPAFRPRPLSLAGAISIILTTGLLFAYFRASRYHHHIPPAVHRLFWAIMGCLILFGAFAIALPYLPGHWKRWWPTVGRNRVAIPREGVGFLLIMGVLFVGASLTQSNTLLLVFAAMAGPFVVNGSVAYTMLKNVKLVRRSPPRAMAGELFSVQVDLENPMSFMSVWMMVVHDQLTFRHQTWNPSILFTRVPPQTVQTGHYQMRLLHRGRHHLGPLQVTSRFPLGLIERGNLFRQHSEMLIYPRIGRLSPSWKRRLMGASELIDTPQPRAGVFQDEFHHLREYRAGDNPRAIHWRSSARRNSLIVRDFQQNREHHLLLVIDLWSIEPESTLIEQTLSLAATICSEHRRACRGARLTVVACGQLHWKWEARANAGGMETLLDRLAIMHPARDTHLLAHLQEVAGQLTSTTRVVVVSTRREQAGLARTPGTPSMSALPSNLHWLSLQDRKFDELVIFSDDRRLEPDSLPDPAPAPQNSLADLRNQENPFSRVPGRAISSQAATMAATRSDEESRIPRQTMSHGPTTAHGPTTGEAG